MSRAVWALVLAAAGPLAGQSGLAEAAQRTRAAWLAHDGNSVFQAQDAHGSMWRIYLTADCQSALAILSGTPLAPLYTGLQQLFGPGGPFEGGC